MKKVNLASTIFEIKEKYYQLNQEIRYYYSPLCPDCVAIEDIINKTTLQFHKVCITESMANLRKFLAVRQNHSAYEEVRADGNIGIPALVINDQIYFDITEELLSQLAKLQA